MASQSNRRASKHVLGASGCLLLVAPLISCSCFPDRQWGCCGIRHASSVVAPVASNLPRLATSESWVSSSSPHACNVQLFSHMRARITHAEKNGIPYCESCYDTKFGAQCAANCGRGLGAQRVKAVGGLWHPECFRCVHATMSGQLPPAIPSKFAPR